MWSPAAVFLVELALKSTVILGIAFAVAALLRRSSAEERHLAWAAAFLALLALPVFVLLGPRLQLPMNLPGAPAGLVADPAGPVPGAVAGGGLPSSEPIPAGPRGRTASAAGTDDSAASPAIGAVPERPTSLRAHSRSGPDAAAALVAMAYLAIALLLIVRYAVSIARVALALRRLDAVTDASVLELCEDIRSGLRLRRRVRLMISRSDSTPWAWGALRPVVVLPGGFSRLPAESQRAALVHELAHVVRLDFVTTLIGCLCSAIYWFQPLAWMASRRMTRDSERACDDRVLLAGSSGTRYASQLLDLARTIQGGRKQPIFAASMAGPSAVAQRITSILDLARRRRTVNRTKVISAFSVTVVLMTPLAALTSQEALPAVDPADAEFRALEQQGPANSDELGLLVRTWVANGRQGEAVQTLADYIARDRAGTAGELNDSQCRFCRSVLEKEGQGAGNPGDLAATVLAAFDEVERRAREAGDGDLLIRLAAIAGASDDGGTSGRGTFYLAEGFRLGNLEDASRLEALRFLDELGWYPQAKALAERLHDDEGSSLYRSPEVQNWIRILDYKVSQREDITQRLMTPDATFAYSEDVTPVFRRAPVYPTAALKAHREGDVTLEFTITEQGRTANVTVINSTDSLFDEAAVESLSQWRYLPQVVDGSAVAKANVRTMIRFVLQD